MSGQPVVRIHSYSSNIILTEVKGVEFNEHWDPQWEDFCIFTHSTVQKEKAIYYLLET